MELILSGYGSKPTSTIARYTFLNNNSIGVDWQDSIENASYVCQGDGYLFTVTEVEDYACVYLYQRNKKGYELCDKRKLEGGSLCHIAYSSIHKVLFGACYGTGTVFSIRVRAGKFEELLFHEIQQGKEPSTLTRAHCVMLNRQENVLVVANIALDQIYCYQILEGGLKLTQVIDVPKGVGPRHALYSQDEKYLYIITEYSNEILVYANDNTKLLLQRISTLPDDYTDTSYCSTLCFSKNGVYLYAANRGADTIALFSVNAEGKLNKMSDYDCGGQHPRHMIVSNDGGYLVVCNQNSDNVVFFSLDTEQGVIKAKVLTTEFAAPSGILEIGV
ncbi:MAG: 3-carboxymuconate cyclase-like protein [Herbinix sp.]|nr:3-carboxymuconate cyclase-like protein [Herbinix sp.]